MSVLQGFNISFQRLRLPQEDISQPMAELLSNEENWWYIDDQKMGLLISAGGWQVKDDYRYILGN